MITYESLLNLVGIISKSDFEEITKCVPNIDNIDGIELYDLYYINSLVYRMINQYLSDNYKYVYVADVSLDKMELALYDVESIKDLEEIETALSNWTIINRKELIEEIREEESKKNNNYQEKMDLLLPLIDRLTTEEIKDLVDNYDNNNKK